MSHFRRMWREADWAVRAIYFVIAAEIVAAITLLAIAVHA
jgi:hypothetical protein